MIHERIVPFESLQNMRDLGGLSGEGGRRIRPGRIYRSGRPSDGSGNDIIKLSSLGITLVIDLRTEEEASKAPDPVMEGTVNMLITVSSDPVTGQSVMDRSSMRVSEKMKLMYRDMILGEASSSAIARVIRCVASEKMGASLLHCTAGKDRTGIICALICEMLGVKWDDIISDYMLTRECLRDFADMMFMRVSSRMEEEPSESFLEDFYDSMLVREEYIISMYDAISEKSGCTDAYIRDVLGFDELFINDFRKSFLEG